MNQFNQSNLDTTLPGRNKTTSRNKTNSDKPSSDDINHDKQWLILNAAEKLIAQKGFQGLSMQKLAKSANVAAGTIYCYFKDKNDLIEAVRLHVLQQVANAVQKGLDEHLPIKERFWLMWKNVAHITSSESQMDMILNRIQYEALPNLKPKDFEETNKLFHKIDHLFTEGKKQGIFKPLDNHILVSLSIDVSLALARPHVQGCYELNDNDLEAAINASWDAVKLNK